MESQEVFKFVLNVNGHDENVYDTWEQAEDAAKAWPEGADLRIEARGSPAGPMRTERWYFDWSARAWVKRA